MTFVLEENLERVKENAKRFLEEFRHNGYSHAFTELSYQGIAAEIFFNKEKPEGLSNRDIKRCYTKLFDNTLLSGWEDGLAELARDIPVKLLKLIATLVPARASVSTIKYVKFLTDRRSTFTKLNSVELVINGDFDLENLKDIHKTEFEEVNHKASEAELRDKIDLHFMNPIFLCLKTNLGDVEEISEMTLDAAEAGRPDKVYRCLRNDKDVIFAVREDKTYPIIKGLDDTRVTLNYNHLLLTASPAAQTVRYMLKGASKLGINSDGQNLIFVEIDHKQTVANLHNCFTPWKGEMLPTVILKILHSRLDSQRPTATKVMLTKLYTAYNDTKNESEQAREEMIENYKVIWKHIQRKNSANGAPGSAGSNSSGTTASLSLNRKNRFEPSTIGSANFANTNNMLNLFDIRENGLSPEGGADDTKEHKSGWFLQPGDLVVSRDDIIERLSFYNCDIFKIRARALKSVIIPEDLVGLHDDDVLVVKLPYKQYDKYVVDRGFVRHENSFVRVLPKLEGFNNCYLRHNDVEIVINSDYVEHDPEEYEFPSFYKGPFILSRYIERVDVTTAEIKDKFEEQNQILLQYGIMHGDLYEDNYGDDGEIAMRNVIYDGEKVYIIDFGDVSYYRDAATKFFD